MSRDPTGTLKIRSAFRRDAERRLRQVATLTRIVLVDHDMLGLDNPMYGFSFFNVPHPHYKLQTFSDWFNGACYNFLVGDWVREHIDHAYVHGVVEAARDLGQQHVALPSDTSLLVQATVLEMSGIADVMVQQTTRMVADGITRRLKPPVIWRHVHERIRALGWPRLKALVHVSTIKAHVEGKLDVFESFGITRIGVIPEHKPMIYKRDARPTIGYRRPKYPVVKPDIEFAPTVEVLTAGDDKVCGICEDIAASGPYDISEARGMIPAHINCRCNLVPAEDLRFAEIEERLR